MPDETKHQANLLDFIAFLLRWRVLLLTWIIGAAVLIAVISFLLPEKFRSRAVVKANESTSLGIGGLIASQLSGLGGVGEALGGFVGLPEEAFVSILKSTWLSKRMIEEFDLRTVYKLPDKPLEDVIVVLESRTRFELDTETGTLLIYAEDRDPKRAQSMTEYLVEELDKRNQELKSTNARSERDFVGQRLTEERARLAALEDSMSAFQLQTGVLDPEEQIKATIQAAALIEAQRLAVQIELDMHQKILGTNGMSELLKIKLASLESSMQSLVRKGAGNRDQRDFFLLLEDTPEYGKTYLRLFREIEIQQLLVGFLLQQYEQSKIEAQRNTPTLMRIDPPNYPTKRVWPRRGLMTVIGTLAGFLLGLFHAIGWEKIHVARTDPTHPLYDYLSKGRTRRTAN